MASTQQKYGRILKWKWIKKQSSSQIFQDASWSLCFKILHTGLSFIVVILLARSLGAQGYGIYSWAYAIITLLALPAQAGLPDLVMRETARGMSQDKPGLVKGIWHWSGKLTLFLTFCLSMLAVFILLAFHESWSGDKSLTILWALGLIPFSALGNLRGAALRGLQRIVAGQIPEFVIRPALFLLIICITIFISDNTLTAPYAMALHVLSAGISFLIGAWLLWRYRPIKVRNSNSLYMWKTWLSSAIPFAFIAGMGAINQKADILMLGLFKPPEQVGIYRVGTQTANLASFGLQAINMVVAPRFAGLFAQNQIRKLQLLVTGSARAVLSFNLMATILFVLIGKIFLLKMFGTSFVIAYFPLLILLIGQLVNSSTGCVGFLLSMTGNERDTVKTLALSATINIGLNLLFIPPWGIYGAAIATSVSMIYFNIFLWKAVFIRLGINCLAFKINIKKKFN